MEFRVHHRVTKSHSSRRFLERTTIKGDSPVDERVRSLVVYLSTMGHEESCGKQGGPPSKAKYC